VIRGPHIGTAQRIRHMRQRCRPIVRSEDPSIVRAREALRGAVYRPEEPAHEFYPVICELLHEAEQRAGGDPEAAACHWIGLVYELLNDAEAA
jgi:hypothetical protein